MACDCISRINAILKEHNTELQIAFFFDGGPSRPIIGVDKIDKKIKKKPQNILPRFCPFCGTEYKKPEAPDLDAKATENDARM